MRRRDFIRSLARDALVERLEPVRVDATAVVELGSGDRSTRRLLKRRFRGATVTSVETGDTAALGDGSVDVVFANLVLPRVGDPGAVFAEVVRILRRGGLFAFSTLGPDTLPGLPDMHDVGDAAVRAGLRDPVLDVDRATLSYESMDGLHRDLHELGFSEADAAGRRRLQLELVYGHCWGPGAAARDGDIRIDPAQITRR